MLIIHIASELAPVAKVGGLGDVVIGLSRKLKEHGEQVAIIIPKYDCIELSEVEKLQVVNDQLWSLGKEGLIRSTIWGGYVEGISVYFIQPHNKSGLPYFDRGCFYSGNDDIERYLFFSRAALEFLHQSAIYPDIIHIHDWQTAIIAPLYQDIYKPLGFQTKGVIFTIHNIEYQGQCQTEDLDQIGLIGSDYDLPAKLQDNLHPENLNLLKGGIVFSSYVTTVSPTYAEEVKGSLGGRGLENTIMQYAYKFSGILNGLDYAYWNPATDRYLPSHYSANDSPESLFAQKAANKKFLRNRLNLADQHRPIVSCISRLVPQKGTHLLHHALFRTLERGGQFILLGTSPIPAITEQFRQLKVNLGNNPHVHFELNYNEPLSHQIYSGSDMFIVPSLFEPCGLTQLISLRYGTIPIVRSTGGLKDTVFDIEYSNRPFHETNGFAFLYPDTAGVDFALDRALHQWFHAPERWKELVQNGMKMDYSWNNPSLAYLNLYHNALSDHG